MGTRNSRDEGTGDAVRRYELILEAIHLAPTPFAVYDNDEVLIAWNPAYQKMYPDAFEGRGPDNARPLSPDDAVRSTAINFHTDKKLGGDVGERVHELRKDRSCSGDRRPHCEASRHQVFRFVPPDNTVQTFARELNALKQTEWDSEQVMPDFASLTGSTKLGAVLVDKDLTVRLINQAYYDLWALEAGDVETGQHIRTLMNVNFNNGAYRIDAGDWDDFATSHCREMAGGKVGPREITLSSGRTLVYAVRELAGGMRLVTYRDISSGADAGHTETEPSPSRLAGATKGEASHETTDAMQDAATHALEVSRDVPESHAGYIGRLRQIVTNLMRKSVGSGNDDHATIDDHAATDASDAPGMADHLRGDKDSGLDGGDALPSAMPPMVARAAETQPADKSPAETKPAARRLAARQLDIRPAQVDILVCEDNDVNQILFTQVLRATGYTFKIANNGHEGVELYKSCQPRLVLMDVSMPEMNGFEATAAIRDLEADMDHHTPIIAVTAHALQGDREKCLDAGMDDYLSKPISPSKLQEKIGDWMNNPDLARTA